MPRTSCEEQHAAILLAAGGRWGATVVAERTCRNARDLIDDTRSLLVSVCARRARYDLSICARADGLCGVPCAAPQGAAREPTAMRADGRTPRRRPARGARAMSIDRGPVNARGCLPRVAAVRGASLQVLQLGARTVR